MSEVRSLHSLIAGGKRFEVEHALYVVIASCKALARADLIGGVSPRRILITDAGDVTIGDPVVEADVIAYCAPEFGEGPTRQFRFRQTSVRDGHVRIESWGVVEPSPDFEIDRPRAAVFAMGCILWELLAGRRLFVGKTDYETLELARAAQVPPIVGIAPELEAIMCKAIARDVAARFQTPSQFADALAGYLVDRASN